MAMRSAAAVSGGEISAVRISKAPCKDNAASTGSPFRAATTAPLPNTSVGIASGSTSKKTNALPCRRPSAKGSR